MGVPEGQLTELAAERGLRHVVKLLVPEDYDLPCVKRLLDAADLVRVERAGDVHALDLCADAPGGRLDGDASHSAIPPGGWQRDGSPLRVVERDDTVVRTAARTGLRLGDRAGTQAGSVQTATCRRASELRSP